MNYTDLIKQSIEAAERGESRLTKEVLELDGMSSNKTRHFFNNIITPTSRYLEIGTWKGSTLISALFENDPEFHIAIDNFSEFTGPRLDFHNNCRQLLSYGNRANFLDAGCFDIDPKDFGINNINTYFYDGKHDYEDQYKAITHYYDVLANEFILIVDDYNWPQVQAGTLDALRDKQVEIKYMKHLPANTTTIQSENGPMTFGDKELWWNGLLVARCVKIV